MMRRLSVRGILLCVWAILACSPLFAADKKNIALKVGENIPDISASDQSGRTRTFRDLCGAKGALLVFHRSARW